MFCLFGSRHVPWVLASLARPPLGGRGNVIPQSWAWWGCRQAAGLGRSRGGGSLGVTLRSGQGGSGPWCILLLPAAVSSRCWCQGCSALCCHPSRVCLLPREGSGVLSCVGHSRQSAVGANACCRPSGTHLCVGVSGACTTTGYRLSKWEPSYSPPHLLCVSAFMIFVIWQVMVRVV